MLARWTWIATLCVVSGYGSVTWGCGAYGFAGQAMPALLQSFERLIKVEAPTKSQRQELRLLCEEIRRYRYEGLDPVLEFHDQADSELPAFAIRDRIARQHPNVDTWIDQIAGQKFAT